MFGKIKWYDKNKVYGFIIADDGQEHFFHKKNIDPNLISQDEVYLKPNDEVSFEIGQGTNGRTQATRIQKI